MLRISTASAVRNARQLFQLLSLATPARRATHTSGQQQRRAAVVCRLVHRCARIQKQIHHPPMAGSSGVGAGGQAILADRLRGS